MLEHFRVHRAQHEMFYNDVMTCFTTLKRAFVEITAAADNQLQGPLTLSKDQLTLRDTGFDIDLDVLDAVGRSFLSPFTKMVRIHYHGYIGLA
ncbi:hypothetical protein M407DRAFT_125369 [Tulasnella calospora MUT 4182]|uniref:Uncharacterized protein n=1 Tax=Tulasnella calospora MUT 4182 TaxID=1051891 RepID=A0A0C3QB88_9AGAM|nr:hypothetical protein M407DRAFT_125369 [Tulasnella calospora MUT 4182]